MSIVGTRPPLISETNLYEPHHKASRTVINIIILLITCAVYTYVLEICF